MVRTRHLTLEEWFNELQLRYASREFTHLPGMIDIDVTALVKAAEDTGQRFSPTAVLIKAAALLLQSRPRLNRMLFHTLGGMRIAEFDEIRVNLPVLVASGDEQVLTAMVLHHLEDKSVPVIQKEIRAFCASGLADKPVARFVATRGNYWWNRFALRILHFFATRFPSLYAREGGGISVTSLIRRNVPGAILRGAPLGQTAFTLAVSSFHPQPDGSYLLSVGVDYNHSVLGGDEASEALSQLSLILMSADTESFYPSVVSDQH